jgi:pimeloyl-ACP methyl ester carboxylesterase
MILPRLALSAAALAAALAGATLWRASAREARAAAIPPAGRFVTVEGARLHLVEMGTGPALVLIHGASGSSRDLTFALAPRLAAEGFRVLAFDRPGLGQSDPVPQGERLDVQARVLAAAARDLGADRPLVLGQSYGGSVALAWALDHPAAGLVLLAAPSLPWPGPLDRWYRAVATAPGSAVLPALAAAWVPDSYLRAQITAVFAPAPVPEGYLDAMVPDLLLRARQLRLNALQVNALRSQIVAMEPRYAALTLPIEFLHGSADTVVPLDIHSGPLAPRLPSATLTVIDGAGHMPQHTHLDLVVAATLRAASRAGLR